MNNIAFEYEYKFNKLNMRFNSLTREVGTFYDELLNTARFIRSSTDKPIMVCLSGGIDSELICRAFLKAGIEFSVVTARHKNRTNDFDIQHARNFCKEFNIPMRVVELDTEDYFVNRIEQHIANGYKSVNIYRYFQLFMMETIESLGGCAVIGSGEQLYYTVDNKICIKYDAGILVPLEWCKNNNLHHFPIFFQSNPEIMYAYQKHPLIEYLLKDQKYFMRLDARYSAEKTLVYHHFFPDMPHRAKYNGYEFIAQFRHTIQNSLETRFPEIKYEYYPVSSIQEQFMDRTKGQ
jgi:hypothetical protein